MNSDLTDLLRSLKKAKARFLIVGGYAVMKYTEPRYTKDVDIWVEPTKVNAKRVYNALVKFGAPVENVAAEDFARQGTMLVMGLAPNRFDILTRIKPLRFVSAWPNRVAGKLAGVTVNFIGLADLIRAKKSAGRAQDLIDLKNLKMVLKS